MVLQKTFYAMVLWFFCGVIVWAGPRFYTEKSLDLKAPNPNGGQPMTLPEGHPPIDAPGLTPMKENRVNTVAANNNQAENSGPLSWTVPDSWKFAQGSGMRLATFTASGVEQDFECTVIILGEMAGEIEPNISRWAGQLGLNLSGEQLKTLIASSPKLKSSTGIESHLFDYSSFIMDQSKPVFLTSITKIPNQVVFTKLIATKSAIKKHREAFESFLKSLEIKKVEK